MAEPFEYAIKKDVRNNPIVREVDRARLPTVLIGLTEAFAGLLFTPSAKSMFAFAILVLVLLLRPQGILGKRAA